MSPHVRRQLTSWRAGQGSGPATSAADPAPTQTFDPELLAKQTYLDTAEAAFYVGYRAPKYADPRKAFMQALARIPDHKRPPKCKANRRVTFRRKDLDAAFRPITELAPRGGRS